MAHRRTAAAALLALTAVTGCSPGAPAAPVALSPAASATTTRPPTTSAPPTRPPTTRPPTPTATRSPAAGLDLRGEAARVEWITDGDTIVTTLGRVRVIGIDTPEKGQCGYQEATDNAAALLPVGSQVVLSAAPGRDDTDKYGRLLRYVQAPDGADLGLAQISGGYAKARYDSRDGYGAHPREGLYVAADAAASGPCGR